MTITAHILSVGVKKDEADSLDAYTRALRDLFDVAALLVAY